MKKWMNMNKKQMKKMKGYGKNEWKKNSNKERMGGIKKEGDEERSEEGRKDKKMKRK